MIRLFWKFIRDHKKNICLYIGFTGLNVVVLSLYNVRMDAVSYAVLLSFIFLLVYGIIGFVRYVRQVRVLEESSGQLPEIFNQLPDAFSRPEEIYQEMIRKLYENQIEQESAERIMRQEMLDYYGMWVHQIKTPIAALRVLLQAGEAAEDREPQKQQEMLREMQMEVFKIEQYVEMVLTYLRMGDMSADLSFEVCELDDIIRQAVRKYSRMFILQKIKLVYEPVHEKVLTDEKWLIFVLEQLLSNSLKYTRTGEISIYMEKECLVLADTGIGIQAEDLPRVFEKGFTGYNGRIDKKSTGIGLYLCKSVMDKLRHQIWITSEEGKGTKVHLYLKRKELGRE